MTVDLLAATFWPETAPLGCRPRHEQAPDPAPPSTEAAADDAARSEGFWAALMRHLRGIPDPAAA